MRAHGAIFALGWLAVASACGDFSGDSPTVAPDASLPVAEAGAEGAAAACSAGCAPNEFCNAAGQCERGCPDRTVYVSPSGSNDNTGCSRTAPKATISGAISFLKTSGYQNHEIHVCAGNFDEHIVLDEPYSLRGGYECALWTRHEQFGFKGFDPRGKAIPFDATNVTTITSTKTPSVLEITGGKISRTVTIEGFTFRGRDTDGGQTVRIVGQAAPTFESNAVYGPRAGALPDSNVASIGVDVIDAGPEIKNCIIDGGAGSGAREMGSIGLHIQSGASVLVHDNQIDSGAGSGKQTSALGMFVEAPTDLRGGDALARNSVFYGASAVEAGNAAMGIVIAAGARADVVENRVIGTTISCPTALCDSFGIAVAGTRSTVVKNRLYGGTSQASPKGTHAYPIFVFTTADEVDVFNNLVDAGVGMVGTSIYGAHPSRGHRFIHNTLFGSPATSAIASYGPDAIVENNLAVGHGIGFALGQCTVGNIVFQPPARLRNNAFVAVSVTALFIKQSGTCADYDTLAGVATLEAVTALHASGNVAMRPASPTCPATDCRSCGSDSVSCLKAIFETPPPFLDVFASTWKLSSGAWCGVARGGVNLDSLILDDAQRASRTSPASIGALELDEACSP